MNRPKFKCLWCGAIEPRSKYAADCPSPDGDGHSMVPVDYAEWKRWSDHIKTQSLKSLLDDPAVMYGTGGDSIADDVNSAPKLSN